MTTLPPNLVIEIGDLLDYPSKGYVIVHQCNCTSDTLSGLAPKVFAKWPLADTRRMANLPRWFGGYTYTHPVVNLFAQKHKGGPSVGDGTNARLDAFYDSCTRFLSCYGSRPIKVAMPYLIGCGMAKGNWEGDYFPLIQKIASEHPEHQFVLVKFAE